MKKQKKKKYSEKERILFDMLSAEIENFVFTPVRMTFKNEIFYMSKKRQKMFNDAIKYFCKLLSACVLTSRKDPMKFHNNLCDYINKRERVAGILSKLANCVRHSDKNGLFWDKFMEIE